MSKKVYLFSFVLLALIFVSCSETEEVSKYDNWSVRNEVYIDSLQNVYDTKADHGGLEKFSMSTASGKSLFYKKLTPVPTDQLNEENVGMRPSSASTVTIYFKTTNILGEYLEGNFKGANPVAGDHNPAEGDTPTTTSTLSKLVVGQQEALEHMKIGERWVVYIPWDYGYGSSNYTNSTSGVSILAYSTLICDIQLLDADPVVKD